MEEEQKFEEKQTSVVEAKTPEKSESDTKIFAALSYLSILFIIPWVIKRDDNYVAFHIKQGLTLFVVEIVVWFVLYMLESLLLTLFSFGAVSIISFLYKLVWLFFAAISIAGVYFAAKGEKRKIPVLWELSKYIKI